MLDWVLFLLTAGAGITVLYRVAKGKLQRRVETLEKELALYTDVVATMSEVQVKTFEKFSNQFDELEGRILDLSVPSPNPDMPLEKRHQVLTLARQGVALDEIARRVKAPVGEAELILNLRRYRDAMLNNPYTTEATAPPM